MAEMLGGLTGSIQGGLQSITNTGRQWLDSIVPPERRAEIWAKLNKFATENPTLASFLLSHIALSGPAITLFVIVVITVAVFALIVALLLALLAAVAFIVMAAGFALVILFPALFFTTFVATAVWLWGWAAYYVVKWFNQKSFPGINTPFVEGVRSEISEVFGIGGGGGQEMSAIEGKPNGADHQDKDGQAKATGHDASNHGNGSARKKAGQNADGQSSGSPKKNPGHKVPEGSRGGVGDAGKHVSGAKDQATGAVGKAGKNVPGGNQVTGAVDGVGKNVPGVG